jgi:hypothetical protein
MFLLLLSLGSNRNRVEQLNKEMVDFMWIFNGESSRFASGVFSSRALAENWILTNKLTGLLTKYPVNQGVYEWSINNNLFSPKKDSEKSSEFIQKFTTASQEHYHYLNGKLD